MSQQTLGVSPDAPGAGSGPTARTRRVLAGALLQGPPDERPVGVLRWLVALVAVAAVHIGVALNATFPVWTRDEAIVLLAGAKMLGNGPPVTFVSSLPYDSAWSLVLGPLWWISDNGAVVYRLAIAVSVLCAVLVVLPLYRLARALDVSPRAALLVAAVVAVLPSRVFDSNYIIVENFLTLVTVTLAATAVSVHEKPSWRTVSLFALVSGLLVITHQRSIMFVAAGIVWLLTWRGDRRRWGWRCAALTAVAAGGAYLLNAWLIARTYQVTNGREESLLGSLRTLTPTLYADAVIGQVWYLVVATLGLALLGAVVLGAGLLRDLRRWEFTPWSYWLVGVVATLALLSVWLISGIVSTDRLDLMMYGRYLDPAALVLTLVGIVTLMRRVSRPVATVAAVGSLAIVWGYIVLLTPRSISQRNQMMPINVPGVLQYPWGSFTAGTTQPWIAIGVTVTVAVAAAYALRRFRHLLPVVVAVLSIGSVAFTEVRVSNPFNDPWQNTCSYGTALDRLRAMGLRSAAALLPEDGNYAAAVLCFSDVDLTPVANAAQAAAFPYVVSQNEWPKGVALGARRVSESVTLDQALWIMPGPQQQAAAAAGLLQPAVNDGRLSDAAARYGLQTTADLQHRITTTTADPASVPVVLEHTGTGEVWRATLPAAPNGAVNIAQQWSCAQGQVEGATSLPRALVPGDEVDVDVVLFPPPGLQGDCTVTLQPREWGDGLDTLQFAGTPLVVPVTIR